MPSESSPVVESPIGRETGVSQQQAWDKQQQQWEAQFKAQQRQFEAQMASQERLWQVEAKLDKFSAGFLLNEAELNDFQKGLSPEQRQGVQQAMAARYARMFELSQQADNPFDKDQSRQVQGQLTQQVLYERYIPVREIYHFGDKFLNGYSPQKMQAVRGYFDQVFEGHYAKGIPEGKRASIMAYADARYTQGTGKEPNREDLLWKTLRNIEASERFPDLWFQFRADLNGGVNSGGAMKTVKGEPLPPLGGFGEGPSISPEVLKPETFPTGGQSLPPLGGFGEGSNISPELLKPETFPSSGEKLPPLGGFGEGPQPKVSNVMLSQSIPWKPSMTEDEAKIYTSESYYKDRVFYHDTNRSGAK
ncbi:MAG: hypothetical protein WCD18_06595 [Thermosynechococcaceae cyanobacterium]